MRRKQIFVMLAFLTVTACAEPPPPPLPPPPPPPPPAALVAPEPGSVADLRSRPWQHVGDPVSDAQFDADKSRCKEEASGATEEQYWRAVIACFRAAGYEPVPYRKGE